MSTRRERAEKRRRWVQAANGRKGLVPRCPNCGDAGPHFVPPSFGDPGFYACDAKSDTEEAKWFCWDCPDHEACATGWPCDNVRELGDRQAFQ